jgi:hypothetical protein
MARWENEDVSGLNLPAPDTHDIYLYGINGEEVDRDPAALAQKIVQTSETFGDTVSYYIKGGINMLDPYGIDSNSFQRSNLTMMKVSENTFLLYYKYLRTKNKLYFIKARQSEVNK